jgi:hypothetical protein
MAFQLSPGVLVTEKDFTNIVPAVSTSAGAFAGAFQWGPVEKVTTVESENRLVELFGKPNDTTATSFFTAANFLSYGNNLQVVRAANSISRNAVANVSGYPLTDLGNVLGNDDAIITTSVLTIKNSDVYDASYSSGVTAVQGNVLFAAKFPGTLGNSLKVSMADANTYSTWEYSGEFDSKPGTSTTASAYNANAYDEMHVIIIDEDGLFSGTKATVLEKFAFVSKASDAKKSDGTNLFYKDVINQSSKYIWWGSHHPLMTNAGASVTAGTTNSYYGNLASNITVSLSGGSVPSLSNADLNNSWSLFANDEEIDISLIPTGSVNSTVAEHIRSAVVEVRKDCVMFVSPELADVVGVTDTGTAVTNAVDHRNTNLNFNTSYAVMDSGWKYQYDRYNDVYRWIPLNGDTAGLCARTDFTNDPWFSPAGFNRGVIKNVVKLAYSPTKAQRDTLYKAGVNPVVSFPGQGTVLFGDKTMLAKPSAFDRINVRRLFIVLEKAIATAAKFQLFEFNDAFTRAQFRNLVEPFLRDVQGRRGITDFKVVCDETNNTGEVIDRNEFVADIYIKPARSINFISLNFIATRTGISFEEVGA